MNQHMTTADHLAAIEPAEVGVARPTFSITILNYNYGRYLPICLDSILNQTFEDFEILLINDSSTDDSLEVIAPYLRDPRITLIDHTTNKGYVASLVEGCEKSRGEFISVISADDWVLDPTAFAQAYHALLSDPSIVMCYSAWHEMDDIGTIRHTRRSKDRDYVADGVEEFRRLILSSPVLHSGTLIRRSAYQQVGGYDTRCRYSVDTNLWLALCAVGKVAYINTPLYAYRAHATNMSNTAGSFWRATEEMLIGIDAAMALFPPAHPAGCTAVAAARATARVGRGADPRYFRRATPARLARFLHGGTTLHGADRRPTPNPQSCRAQSSRTAIL